MEFTLSSGWEIGTRWQGGMREAWAGSAGWLQRGWNYSQDSCRAQDCFDEWAKGKGWGREEDGHTYLRFWPCGRPGRCRPRGRWAGWTVSTRWSPPHALAPPSHCYGDPGSVPRLSGVASPGHEERLAEDGEGWFWRKCTEIVGTWHDPHLAAILKLVSLSCSAAGLVDHVAELCKNGILSFCFINNYY